MNDWDKMRQDLIATYGGSEKWAEKVAEMNNKQVEAIWLRLKKTGRLINV